MVSNVFKIYRKEELAWNKSSAAKTSELDSYLDHTIIKNSSWKQSFETSNGSTESENILEQKADMQILEMTKYTHD